MYVRLRLFAAAILLALAGCGQGRTTQSGLRIGESRDELNQDNGEKVELVYSDTAYVMPVEDPDSPGPGRSMPTESDESNVSSSQDPDGEPGPAAPGLPHLNYYGGPVIPNVKVITIFWGAGVNNQAALNRFYSTITNSPYMDWLRQYSTRTQAIGRGRLAASHVDTGHPPGGTITNAQIQAELNRLITVRAVAPPDGNTLYMFHFPAGISITMGTDRSCVTFCAYHSTFIRNGVYVYYGVMPDLSGACARGCGPNTYFNNTTSASSHELIESITDAAVGRATRLGPPLAWYDPRYGEIGDICNQNQALVAGFVVQRGWSNAGSFCRAQ